MGLIRFALIALAVVVALFFIKRLLAAPPMRKPPPSAKPTPKLVQCAHCGLHVAESDAIRVGDRYYCSAEHQQRDAQR